MRQNYVALFALAFIIFIPDCYALGFGLSGAGGEPVAGVLDRVLDLMTGRIARTIAALAIVGSGYLAFIGRLSWTTIINLSVGIGLIFGGSKIAQLLIG